MAQVPLQHLVEPAGRFVHLSKDTVPATSPTPSLWVPGLWAPVGTFLGARSQRTARLGALWAATPQCWLGLEKVRASENFSPGCPLTFWPDYATV